MCRISNEENGRKDSDFPIFEDPRDHHQCVRRLSDSDEGELKINMLLKGGMMGGKRKTKPEDKIAEHTIRCPRCGRLITSCGFHTHIHYCDRGR